MARLTFPDQQQDCTGGVRRRCGGFGPPSSGIVGARPRRHWQRTPLLQCNRGRAPNALAACFLLIEASILAARKLAKDDGGKRVPATVSHRRRNHDCGKGSWQELIAFTPKGQECFPHSSYSWLFRAHSSSKPKCFVTRLFTMNTALVVTRMTSMISSSE